MKNLELKTLQSIIDYLTEAKGRVDRLKKRNPDLSFTLGTITGVPIDVMFEAVDLLNKDLEKWSTPSKISESYDKKHLTLYVSAYGKSAFPMPVSLQSVEIEKLSEPIPTRELYKEVKA